jgi:predicted deacylase
MRTFETFHKQRRVKAYNESLASAIEGYANLSQIGTVDGEQIYKIVINPEGWKTVCFISGIHGDEPAGPLGVLKFLEERVHVPRTKRVVILPLVNPTGIINGTRKNGEDKDINRGFLDDDLDGECKQVWDAIKDEKVSLLHTLHEDPEVKDFYLYYTDDRLLAEDIRGLASKFFSISREEEMYNDKMREGLIPLPHVKRGSIEDKMLEMGIPYITTETPGKTNLSRRVDFNKDVMKLVIQNL